MRPIGGAGTRRGADAASRRAGGGRLFALRGTLRRPSHRPSTNAGGPTMLPPPSSWCRHRGGAHHRHQTRTIPPSGSANRRERQSRATPHRHAYGSPILRGQRVVRRVEDGRVGRFEPLHQRCDPRRKVTMRHDQFPVPTDHWPNRAVGVRSWPVPASSVATTCQVRHFGCCCWLWLHGDATQKTTFSVDRQYRIGAASEAVGRGVGGGSWGADWVVTTAVRLLLALNARRRGRNKTRRI